MKNKRQSKQNSVSSNPAVTGDQPKLVLIGLSKAGKTSIINKFFFSYSIEEIQKIKPTVLFSLSAPTVERLKRQITIYDLGGQKEFIQEHLKNKAIFMDAKALLIVIDIQAPHRSNEVELFITKLKELLDEIENNPEIFIFLHKHDPDKREDRYIYQSIVTYMNVINSIFGKKPNYQLTSIFDQTIYEAMIKVIFLIVPDAIISDMNFKGIAKAYPIILKSYLHKADKKSVITEEDRKELRQYAAKFGKYYLGLKQKDWKEDKIKNRSKQTESESSLSDEEIGVKVFPLKFDSFKIEIDCSVLKNLPEHELSILKESPSLVNTITHGIMEGMANLIGYKTVTCIKSCDIEKDDTESSKCEFHMTMKL